MWRELTLYCRIILIAQIIKDPFSMNNNFDVYDQMSYCLKVYANPIYGKQDFAQLVNEVYTLHILQAH